MLNFDDAIHMTRGMCTYSNLFVMLSTLFSLTSAFDAIEEPLAMNNNKYMSRIPAYLRAFCKLTMSHKHCEDKWKIL